jgi:HD-GYP domain-containing protein (c-di-GMP phosphodiesterase class II)
LLAFLLLSSYFDKNKRVEIQNRGYDFVSRFAQDLRSVASVPRNIAAHVGINPDIDQASFEEFALSVRKSNDIKIEILAMQLAPRGVVTYEQPFSGGPHIGHDLLADEARKQAVNEALRLNATITDGPVNLMQGGKGLIIRHPVTVLRDQVDASSTFWGLATVLVNWSVLEDRLISYEQQHDTSITLVKFSSYDGVKKVIYGEKINESTAIKIGEIDLYGVTYDVYENFRFGISISSYALSFIFACFLGALWFLLLKNIELKKLSTEKASDYYERIYEVIINVAKARDDATGAHQIRTAKIAVLLLNGYQKNLPAKEISLSEVNFQKAISLHDIGKIAISDRILRKPGPLNAKERAEMETHPEKGATLLATFMESSEHLKNDIMLHEAKKIAMHHHENWNGSGYPSGLKGEEIPLSARIMSIVDVYDALRSKRPYKSAFDRQTAMEEMKRVSASKFDPKIFQIFLSMENEINEVFELYASED